MSRIDARHCLDGLTPAQHRQQRLAEGRGGIGDEHFHVRMIVNWFRIRTFWRLPNTVAQENLIEISDLTFAYDRRPILSGISMVIPRGKVVAIMGVSGSGKTTLLRLISGVVKATKGQVTVDGQDVKTLDQDGIYALRGRM